MADSPYRIAALEALIGTESAELEATLALFVSTGLAWREECRVAHGYADLRALARLGHRMKSSARAIGADRLSAACVRLEAAAEGGGTVASTEAGTEALTEAFAALDAVVAAISADLAARHSNSASSASGRENR